MYLPINITCHRHYFDFVVIATLESFSNNLPELGTTFRFQDMNIKIMEEESKHAVPDTPLERRQLVHIIDASPAEGRSVGLFPVREHAAVLLEDPNKLYMIGGSRHKARTNQFWVLDMGTQVVSLFVGAHLPPRHSCMAKVDA